MFLKKIFHGEPSKMRTRVLRENSDYDTVKQWYEAHRNVKGRYDVWLFKKNFRGQYKLDIGSSKLNLTFNQAIKKLEFQEDFMVSRARLLGDTGWTQYVVKDKKPKHHFSNYRQKLMPN